jgi:flagellar motor switch protein FliM
VVAVTTPEESETEPAAFDFARPGRLTRERARLIQSALDEVARQASDVLRLWIEGVQIEAGEVEERAAGDLIGVMADHVLLSLPLRAERGLLITEMALAHGLMLNLLGGPPPPETTEFRPMTHLETELLDLVLVPLLECISSVLRLGSIEIEVHESDPEAVNFIDERELMLAIPFNLSTERFSGTVRVVLPPGSFQPFMLEQERSQAGRRSATRPGNRARNEAALQSVHVPVVCGFLPIRVPARELAMLQPGDVLRTGQPTSRDLVFLVGDKPVFGARAGQRGQRLVGEVISVLAPTNPTRWFGGTP